MIREKFMSRPKCRLRIVCGLRGVVLRIVEQLNLSGVPAVVLEDDPDPRLARILLAWGVPRVARLMALALRLDELVRSGQVASYSALASFDRAS